jgi:NADH:ubiquinone oxidoreductase subunit E
VAKIDKECWKKIDEVIEKYKIEKGDFLSLLEEVQAIVGHLPPEVQERIAEQTGVSKNTVYGVVTFYTLLYTKPVGKKIIRVCDSISCCHKGSERLLTQLEKRLHIMPGQTTADGEFTLETVSCLGACDKAVNVMVNEKFYHNVKEEDIGEILR